MIFATFALLAQSGRAQAPPIAHLASYIRSARTLSAELTLSAPGVKTVGTVKLVYSRPNRLYYSIKWDELNYTFVGTEKGRWDADVITKTYDEFPNWQFDYPMSAFCEAPSFFTPGFLFDGTLASEHVYRMAAAGTTKVNGIEADKIEDAGGAGKVELDVDKNGRPLRFIFNRRITITAEIKSLVINKPVSPTLFAFDPPPGYQPYTVPLATIPTKVGDAFPLKGWQPAGFADLISSKPTLVMLTTPDCEPSARAAAALQQLRDAGLINVATLSLAASGAVPSGLERLPKFFDSTGRITAGINAPGTPFFYLLNTKGVVLKAWYGFDPDKASIFIKDVADSAK
jgi:outer membrane lipoprotein-sorting protein